MKSTVFVAILFLVTLAATLWLLGVFDAASGPSTTEPSTPRPAEKAAPDLASAEPTKEPAPAVPELAEPVRVLVLGETPRSFTTWLPMLWRMEPKIRWQMWFGETPASTVATHAEDVPPLPGKPSAADLEGVRVLVLAGVDPARFPDAFWVEVARRVREKALGLLVLAEHRFAKAYADQPALREVLPIRGARPVAAVAPGSPIVAGVFEGPRPFAVTPAGRTHPASRIVPWPDWSEKHWIAQASGKGAWTTKFVAPIEGPAADAQVLVEVDAGDGRVPAFVASAGTNGRVLWIGGFFDLERSAYTGTASFDRAQSLGISWVGWLSGQVS